MAAASSARKPLNVLSNAMEGVEGEYSDVLRYLSAERFDDYYRAFEEVVDDELNDFWPRYNSLTEKQTRQLATDVQTARTDAFVHMVAEIHACMMEKTPKKMIDRLNELCDKHEHSSDPKCSMLKKFCQVKSRPATQKGLDVIKKLSAIARERVVHNQRIEAERVRASELAAAEAEEQVRLASAAAAAAAVEAAEQTALELAMPRAEDRRQYAEMMAQGAELERLLLERNKKQHKGGKHRNKSHKKRSYRKRSHMKKSYRKRSH